MQDLGRAKACCIWKDEEALVRERRALQAETG